MSNQATEIVLNKLSGFWNLISDLISQTPSPHAVSLATIFAALFAASSVGVAIYYGRKSNHYQKKANNLAERQIRADKAFKLMKERTRLYSSIKIDEIGSSLDVFGSDGSEHQSAIAGQLTLGNHGDSFLVKNILLKGKNLSNPNSEHGVHVTTIDEVKLAKPVSLTKDAEVTLPFKIMLPVLKPKEIELTVEIKGNCTLKDGELVECTQLITL